MKIFLASTSPRRRQLLTQVGFEYDLLNPEVDEIERAGESPKAMVKRFALDKATGAFTRLSEAQKGAAGIIIAADTTVVSPDGKRVLNKPTSVKEAAKILKTISGKSHIVFTGYVVFGFRNGKIVKRHYRVVKTAVKMRKLSSAIIADYIASNEPMDKAGAYGAQGIGMALIESIRGSYSNVIGLPMAELLVDLETKFKLKPKWRTTP